MKISVIIPALNEAESIAAAVDSAWAASADEVHVADGGSTDATAEIAAAHRAVVLAAPRGRAAQQNAAARQARGDVLLFLHADNRLPPAAGEQIRAALRNSRASHGCFRQRIDAAVLAYRWLERGNAARARWLGLPYGDQAIFVRRKVFEDAGGFPEAPLMEDVLLMRTLRRRACPLLLAGPVAVSPRRWQTHGLVRQTLRNWLLLTLFTLGVSPQRLAQFYPRHDAARR